MAYDPCLQKMETESDQVMKEEGLGEILTLRKHHMNSGGHPNGP